jgi:hypothetical protein
MDLLALDAKHTHARPVVALNDCDLGLGGERDAQVRAAQRALGPAAVAHCHKWLSPDPNRLRITLRFTRKGESAGRWEAKGDGSANRK